MGIVWLEQHLSHFKASLLHAFELCCQIPFTFSLHLPIILITLGCGNAGLTPGIHLTVVLYPWKMRTLNGSKWGTVTPEAAGIRSVHVPHAVLGGHLETDGLWGRVTPISSKLTCMGTLQNQGRWKLCFSSHTPQQQEEKSKQRMQGKML